MSIIYQSDAERKGSTGG